MLQKSKSKTIAKFKFLLVIPLLAMMLIYVSCSDERDVSSDDPSSDIENLISKIESRDNLTSDQKIQLVNSLQEIEDKMLGSSRFESSDKVKVVQGYGSSSSSTADVPFGVIEEVPAFAGCEGLKTNEERKACTSDKIREFVAGNFDTKIGKDFLKEGDLVRVIVQFKIDETGNIRDIRAKAPVPELEEEAKRVVNSLPQMTPGKQRGKAVGVVYSLPIVFQNGGGKTSGAANNTAGSLPPPPPSAPASK